MSSPAIFRSCVPILCLLVVAGCNPGDARDLGKDASKLAKTGGRVIGNAALVGRINAQLLQQKGVDISGLHIEAKDGVVTLGGHVRSNDERKRVKKSVGEIRGVDKVVDNLRVEKPK